ncbi:histidine phosphatase superfamily [Gaertneriomyces semiglobifer]|nr:histidine phosphatase superfamily [Gaertneriomyces semiglobifer]
MSPSYPAFPPLTAAPSPSAVVKRLYLCRHGETAANQKQLLQGSGIDESLNATGVRQAEALRDRLTGYEFDLIVSSKLKRTEETAEIVAQPHSATTPYIQVPELAEISWGDWEGTHAPHLRHLLKSWEEGNFEASAPNGETPLQVEQRAVPAVYELAQRPEKSILVISKYRCSNRLGAALCYGFTFQLASPRSPASHHHVVSFPPFIGIHVVVYSPQHMHQRSRCHHRDRSRKGGVYGFFEWRGDTSHAVLGRWEKISGRQCA